MKVRHNIPIKIRDRGQQNAINYSLICIIRSYAVSCALQGAATEE